MPKTKTFRIISGRVHFKCYSCQGKRMVAVRPEVRRRTIRCHRCGEITRCNFNRRLTLREQQRGKALMSTRDGSYIEVDLYDISFNGIGLDVAYRDIRKISVGTVVRFKCTWMSKLFNQSKFEIRSIKGRRVGAQRNKW